LKIAGAKPLNPFFVFAGKSAMDLVRPADAERQVSPAGELLFAPAKSNQKQVQGRKYGFDIGR
jgi:hypothetical protein